jgi:hypothetical protein
VIDELLPEVTTEALAALMQRDEEQRPVEGISWELKSEVSKNRIPPDRLCVRQYARRYPDPRGDGAREADQWICRLGRRGRLGDDSREHDSRRCVPLAGLVPDRSPLPREAGAPGPSGEGAALHAHAAHTSRERPRLRAHLGWDE